MKNNFAGLPIMKEEVETAMKKMRHGKATGPDNISVELIEALEDFGIGKVTHLLNEIYDTGTFQDIKRGVRKGCVLSPDLVSLYSQIIMRNLENHPGIKVGGQNINNLRYADDTVLIAENKEDLQKLLNIVEEESRKKGLELNSRKTEVTVISHK
ncbi:retrovirus-related pol polyprotein from type-1 retrotransposable element r2 [Plakobranchus ocellatus]|uniref:Retrovirus-related pol polyprotein from type-1 retrotransposable element r2 n=1 Tax=Plakobranchus ocellatus TaxID=259542 RepID=A0AAV4ARJ5_9GAST|nr:retrovirus-related pol polyprotein from type-1 retrotransposable element r2 [Plakobranchus ocellatus]